MGTFQQAANLEITAKFVLSCVNGLQGKDLPLEVIEQLRGIFCCWFVSRLRKKGRLVAPW